MSTAKQQAEVMLYGIALFVVCSGVIWVLVDMWARFQ